jgi:hypothetical protein
MLETKLLLINTSLAWFSIGLDSKGWRLSLRSKNACKCLVTLVHSLVHSLVQVLETKLLLINTPLAWFSIGLDSKGWRLSLRPKNRCGFLLTLVHSSSRHFDYFHFSLLGRVLQPQSGSTSHDIFYPFHNSAQQSSSEA